MGYELQTSDDLLTHFKRDSYIPSSQGNYTDPQLLAVADLCILKDVFPLLKRLGHGWYLDYVDTTFIASTRLYQLPRYAMAGIVHSIELVDANGVKIADIAPTTRLQADLHESNSTGTPSHFELMHNKIRLNRTPSTGDITNYRMRVWFYRRPGRLVLTSSAGKVLTVVGTTITYTAAIPSGFTATSSHDFYRGESPFDRTAENVVSRGVGVDTQLFLSAPAALLDVDDYVCLRDETVFPDCPIELYPFLIDLMDARLARAKGDAQAYALATKEAVAGMQNAIASAPGDRVKVPTKLSLAKSGLLGGMGGRKMVSND